MGVYLVTGGGGFIGSNLVEALLTRGDDVRVLDNFSTGRRVNLENAPRWARDGGARFELIEGDIRDLDACRAAVRGCDFVLHQAAIPSVQRSVQDPVTTNDVNVGGTLHVLSAAREAGVKRIVAASSSSLYGESEVLPKVETMPPAPISPYGAGASASLAKTASSPFFENRPMRWPTRKPPKPSPAQVAGLARPPPPSYTTP